MKLCNILIFRLPLALNEHGLKMPILANKLFGRQISLSQHFEQRNCNVPRFFVWREVLDHAATCNPWPNQRFCATQFRFSL